MKKLGQRMRELNKKWYVVLVIWLMVITWGTCRIYVKVKLDQVGKQANNDRVVFNYTEAWDDLEEVKSYFEKDFMKTVAHVSQAVEKDNMMNLKAGHYLGRYSGVANVKYEDTRPYKFAYFYEINKKNNFEKSVWLKTEKDNYLDIISINYETENTYTVSISKDDLEKIRVNKEQILGGETVLRPKSFDKVPYDQLADNGFYTYLKNEKKVDSPYTYMYVKHKERYKNYSNNSKDMMTYNSMIFRYQVNENGIEDWGDLYGTIAVVKKKDFMVMRENEELLQNINNRTEIEPLWEAEADSSLSDGEEAIENLVSIQGIEEYEVLKDKDFSGNTKSEKNKKWKEYVADPNKKARSVTETIVEIAYEEKMLLLDLYMRNTNGAGRADLLEAEKIIKKDIEESGKSSMYYKWVGEYGLDNSNEGKLSVDFGEGIVN